MPLLPSEVSRIKAELGYNLLSVNADPYIGHSALFEAVIQPFMTGGAVTTSSTSLVATGTPTAQAITLASVEGISAGDVVIIDVDASQERATIQSLIDTVATVQVSLAHAGQYPVVVEGGESIVRDILRELRLLMSGMNGTASTLSSLRSRVGLKKVDDVEFFGGGQTLASQGIDPLTQVSQLREFWRDELASALGIERLNSKQASGGSSMSVY